MCLLTMAHAQWLKVLLSKDSILAFFPFIFSAGPLLSPIHVIDLHKYKR